MGCTTTAHIKHAPARVCSLVKVDGILTVFRWLWSHNETSRSPSSHLILDLIIGFAFSPLADVASLDGLYTVSRGSVGKESAKKGSVELGKRPASYQPSKDG